VAAAALPPVRVFHVLPDRFVELPDVPLQLPEQGFVWLGTSRSALETAAHDVQAALQRWAGGALVDLHLADLLNDQLPSHYDYTSWYDLMVFRRLAAAAGPAGSSAGNSAGNPAGPLANPLNTVTEPLTSLDTSPVGFAVFDRVLLTVHPSDCAVREHFATRLLGMVSASQTGGPGGPGRSVVRLPISPADLMLRMVNHMVDSYLDLRRLLTRQFAQVQQQLLDPRNRFNDWQTLLGSRGALHVLEDTCEDQRSAVQEWIDALDEWPPEHEPDKQRERELLRVRSRDVLEHVERVLSHVRRLEQSAEAAVQMHFSALGHRTNDIMRTLTVLTAIFLPLNLITGFFGMNFDGLPLIHTATGVWLALGLMLCIAVVLIAVFWRKRYIGRSRG
jgi:magnesium transporter